MPLRKAANMDFVKESVVMRRLILASACLIMIQMCASAQSFDVASVKPASPSDSGLACHGGPGTSDPSLWRCANFPIGLLITQAYELDRYQFRANDPCCTAKFDVSAKLPPGATKEQFHQMIRNLLQDRFQLKLHFEKKDMTVYELSVTENGLKLKESSPVTHIEPDDPWASPEYKTGKDGYPVFPPGRGGIAGAQGHYRWVAFSVSTKEICKTLSFYLGGPVSDATGLTGAYDIDLRWWIDIAWVLERAGHPDLAEDMPYSGRPGPPLTRAVNDQLGLKLGSHKGQGEIVIIDHLERAPGAN